MYRGQRTRADTVRSFPRTRGDVPRFHLTRKPHHGLPPHTRGCTLNQRIEEHVRDASPAHAGMYLERGDVADLEMRFPRTRGDVPGPGTRSQILGWLPPHTRGCTRCRAASQPAWSASPAHAGMYPASVRPPRPASRFPRTRGDVPTKGQATSSVATLPPHTRGCTLTPWPTHSPGGASPAHAGMYPSMPTRRRVLSRFPRTRGDVPLASDDDQSSARLPPHTRGCTVRLVYQHAVAAASPAHAGMYPWPTSMANTHTGFPRTRGDVPDPPELLPVSDRHGVWSLPGG